VILGLEEFFIGRSQDCHATLLGDGVSRKHARIFWDGTGHSIADMGSTNGTEVNGQIIKTARRLVNDDTIVVGQFKLRFLITDATREELAAAHNPRLTDTDRHVSLSKGREAQLSGTFSGTILIEACQLIELNKHSGEMRIDANGLTGWIRFRGGVIVDAKLGINTGEQAARRILNANSGKYSFARANENPPAGPISLRVGALAMDLLRAKDEAAAALAQRTKDDTRGEHLEGFTDAAPDDGRELDDGPLRRERGTNPGEETRKITRPPLGFLTSENAD
jgi:hypothetical protein